MLRGRNRYWAVGAGGCLASVGHPAYALGDQIIPGTAALLASPLLLGLFWGVFYVTNRDDQATTGRPARLVLTGALGVLFSVGWLLFLIVLAPSTWAGGTEVGWGLTLGYLLPLTGLAGLRLLRERGRLALVLLGAELLVGVVYWVGWQL